MMSLEEMIQQGEEALKGTDTATTDLKRSTGFIVAALFVVGVAIAERLDKIIEQNERKPIEEES